MKRIIFILTLIAFLSSNIFGQAIPKQISYQGVLKDASGNILTGNFTMTFKIYNDPTGGSALWTETQAVSVANGLFGVQLGSANPITTVPFDRIHFLGITVGTESELTPRTLLSPSPYSFISMNVLDNVVTTNKILDGMITANDIGNYEVIKKINGIRDSVNFIAGSNITLTPSGNNITIDASPGGSGTIGGSGTSNYLPLFTGSTVLGNSIIYQTAGGNIGIGTTTPNAKLELSGSDALINGLTIGRGNGLIITNTALGIGTLNSNTTGNRNIAIGNQSLFYNTTGLDNTAIGFSGLYRTTTGNGNTAIGSHSLYFNISGENNTAVGVSSLFSNLTGKFNTAIGTTSLYSNTTGNENTANGAGALYSNTTGIRNTASGVSALNSNTEGHSNTANGRDALFNNITGNENTALGVSALISNVAGSNATAIGYNAMFYANNTATAFTNYNVAVGYEALRGSTTASANTGNLNTALGSATLWSNTTGFNNTANGATALYSNTTGYNNTANGRDALYSNTTGNYNTANGRSTLFSNVAGSNATAIGYNAMFYANNTATAFTNYNVAVGYEALRGSATASANTGNSNTALGYQTLFSNTTGDGNTTNGLWALFNNTTGYVNTALGYSAGASVTTGSNLTLIGSGAEPTSGSATNQITLGDFSVTSLRCAVTSISSLSDARDKKNVQELSLGLDFISKLKPRQFNWDKREWYKNNISDGSKMQEAPTAGFIAQELDDVQTTQNTEWLNLVLKDNPEKIEATPGNLLPIMVKAIQELKTENEGLKKRLSEFETVVKLLVVEKKSTENKSLGEVR